MTSSPSSPERCRILIVGAGLAGAATAWHLRDAGVERVVLLEKEELPGVHASGRNAAMLRERMDHTELQALASESAAVLRRGDRASFRPTGGTLVKDGTREHYAGDGVVDVAGLLHGYLAGQDVRYGVAFERMDVTPDGVQVETSAGTFLAETVVNAAGPWAGVVGDLPLTPRNRHLFVSAPDAAIDPDGPFTWDLDHGYYLRPESGGWLLCACDEAAAAPGAYAEDPDVVESLGRKLREHVPDLADLRIARSWVGQRTFAEDSLPVVGFDPRTPSLFHVAGLGGHGVTLSHAIGRVACDLLLGRDAPEARPLGADRLVATARAPS